MKPLKQQGFTLIELIIAIAILGIVSAIAIPSYQSSITKGRRNECRVGLAAMMQEQERQYSKTFSYLAVPDSSASTVIKNWSGDGTYSEAYCKMAATTCVDTTDLSKCVRLVATPTYSDADIQSIELDSRGAQTCNPSTKQLLCWPK